MGAQLVARPTKAVVDYFPHICVPSKTLFIIENQFGDKGYIAWFKTLEQLGVSENHYIDCNNEDTWEFLLAKIRIDSDLLRQIFTKLARLGGIDKILWDNNIVFSQNFIDGIRDAYKKRKIDLLEKESLFPHLFLKNDFTRVSTSVNSINTSINPQSKVKETIVNKTIVNEIKLKETSSLEDEVEEDVFFKKFISELSFLKNYTIDEDKEEALLNSILLFQPNPEKIMELTTSWIFTVMDDTPLENPRGRLLAWIKKQSEADIKAQKIAQSKAETQKNNAVEIAQANAEPTIEEKIQTKDSAIGYINQFKPSFWSIGLCKVFIEKFGIKIEELNGGANA